MGLFAWIWVETHFPFQSSFNDLMQINVYFIDFITENEDISSANNFAFDDSSSAKSLTQTKKKKRTQN